MPKPIQWKLPVQIAADRVNLHHHVAGRIGSLIAQGALGSGAVLPNEDLLSGEFGVSRTALREAIKVLASKRLVEVRRKTGTRVRPHAEWNMLDPEVLGWLFSGSKSSAGLFDLLEVRRLVEPAGARMAAERATAEELLRIGEGYQKMEMAADDLHSSVEADLEFHLAILEASHNAFMLPFGALIQTALRASFRLTNKDKVSYRRSLTLHRAVMLAVCNRKGAAAERAMLAVLRQTSADIDAQSAGSSQPRVSVRSHGHPLHRSI